MRSQGAQLKNVISLYAFLLVVWGFYRALFRLPEEAGELVLKPIIWLGPVAWMLFREGVASPAEALVSVGWTTKNLFKSIYIGLGLGVLFGVVALLANVAKYGSTSFSTFGLTGASLAGALGLSVATAISEETVFRGFIFRRIWQVTGHELFANVVTTIGWAVIHLPVLIFVYKLGLGDVALRFFLTSILGFGSAFVFARTGNIASSVLLHVLWSWPIILFR